MGSYRNFVLPVVENLPRSHRYINSIGKLIQKVEDAKLNQEIRTREEALELAARLLDLEGDAGIEPATPSSGGLCSIR